MWNAECCELWILSFPNINEIITFTGQKHPNSCYDTVTSLFHLFPLPQLCYNNVTGCCHWEIVVKMFLFHATAATAFPICHPPLSWHMQQLQQHTQVSSQHSIIMSHTKTHSLYYLSNRQLPHWPVIGLPWPDYHCWPVPVPILGSLSTSASASSFEPVTACMWEWQHQAPLTGIWQK